jgi:short-subunit dehydrogenase
MSARLVFITGATDGIGRALALRFQRGGYRLALIARRAEQVGDWARALGWSQAACAGYAADVCDISAVTAAGRACVQAQGIPDIVIASAGISVGVDTALLQDLEVMRSTYETNNLGLAATFQPFIEPMRRRGSGTLVGIASVAGIRGMPRQGAYCPSKAAVISYCQSLRGELGPSGVKVVTLLPGYIDRSLTRANRYSIPFLMRADAFAERAFGAIVAGASYRVIPWQMGVVAKLLRAVPSALFDRLLAGRPRKHRQGE